MIPAMRNWGPCLAKFRAKVVRAAICTGRLRKESGVFMSKALGQNEQKRDM